MIPPNLIKLINENRVIPFIGAGFSFPSGIPSWSELTRQMIELGDMDDKRILHQLESKLKEPDLAELIDSLQLSSSTISDLLVDQINNVNFTPGNYHKLLCELPFDTIITTNWDILIEQQFAQSKIPFNVIYNEDSLTLFRPEQKVQILKIHGTITDYKSLIYKKSHYSDYWERNSLLFSIILSLMVTKSFLFIGYGMGDPNVTKLLQLLKSKMGKTALEHYALTYGPANTYFNILGVTEIHAPDFTGNNYEESTVNFLNQLKEESQRKSISNFERSTIVNRELKNLIRTNCPKSTLYFKGTLGWLSNPEPEIDKILYGSADQDAVEYEMTNLVKKFLRRTKQSYVKNILNISKCDELLFEKFCKQDLIRRLLTLKDNFIENSESVLIVNDEVPHYVNLMIFDKNSYLIGYKRDNEIGIKRITVSKDRRTIKNEIENFDSEFREILETNREQAFQLGINVNSHDWLTKYIVRLIDQKIEELNSSIENSDCDYKKNDTLLVARCLHFAIENHNKINQRREDSKTPYYVHLLRVIERIINVGINDPIILGSAALHDVVEDCSITSNTLIEEFGPVITEIVLELTQSINQSEIDYCNQIANSSDKAKIIKLADRWDNVWELKTKMYSSYGGILPQKYLENSMIMLQNCKGVNINLYNSLKKEIEEANKIFRNLIHQ